MTHTDARLELCRKIILENYRTQMHIGAYEKERGITQPVVWNVFVWIALPHASANTLAGVYDYTLIPEAINAIVTQGHIDLQETLADELFRRLFTDARVMAAQVKTTKPQAYPNCDGISIETFAFNPHIAKSQS